MDVLCIGHASWDITVLLDEFPREDAKYETRELHECGGGPAANAAYLLAKWGLRAGFVGVAASDRHGWQMRQELLDVGVDLSRTTDRAAPVTPISVILVNRQNGSRTIINRKAGAAPAVFTAEAIPPVPLVSKRPVPATRSAGEASLGSSTPKVLLFDGHEPTASLTALASYPDAISILDAGSWREGTAELAARVDYLAASSRFAMQASGLANLETEQAQRECVARLRERYCTWIIVTLGARGLVYDVGEGFRTLPAFPAKALDTTGAGDIWHGAFAYGIACSLPLLEALRLASMAASLSVRKLGGRTSVPTLEEVRQALAAVSAE